jgi:hypothetical protein
VIKLKIFIERISSVYDNIYSGETLKGIKIYGYNIDAKLFNGETENNINFFY